MYAKEATPEQKQKAIELKLPLNFFLYEDAPPCPGCRGCERDSDDAKESGTTKPAPAVSFFPSQSLFTKTGTPSFAKMADASVSQLSFSSLTATNSSGFNKPAAFSWSGTGAPIFGVSIVIILISRHLTNFFNDYFCTAWRSRIAARR